MEMNNKYITITSSITGKVLISPQYFSGIINIPNNAEVVLTNIEDLSAGSEIQIFFDVGATALDNEAQTRQLIYDALEKLYSASYTDSAVELKFPGWIVSEVLLIL